MAKLTPEPAYAFRRELATPHATDQRDPAATVRDGELTIDRDWTIVASTEAPSLVRHVARDLQDYFDVSMGISLRVENLSDLGEAGTKTIALGAVGDLSGFEVPSEPRSFRLVIGNDRVVICGSDERGAAQGSYAFEDALNLRGGPFAGDRDESRTARFSPRMLHSGYALDTFPDGHLNQMAHAGIDAILVFASGVNRSPDEYTHRDPARHSPGRLNDFNDLARRAGTFGIDLYFYAYPHGTQPPHPDEPGAERYYHENYGALFEACPEAKGIILVGESVEFPSKDPRTNGRLRLDPVPGGLPDPRPLPGWYPCVDYPEWVSLVTKVCRKHKADADIVFWTYNWGWAPEEERLALIRSLPTVITVQATFEMFERVERDGYTSVCVDYTASSVGPGTYFASEAAAAHERGIRLYTMANTGGLTWDFGSIPYEPVPFQWAKRHRALQQAADDWGLSGVMESHHFGWWPSIVSELAKANYWSPAPDADATISSLARRDFSDGADQAVAAWRAWSEAITDYVPTNEDQYGPFRIGPAYPLGFQRTPQPPDDPTAMFGTLIAKTPYQPENGNTKAKTASGLRVRKEVATLQRMLATWNEGIVHLEGAIAVAPAHKAARNARMLNMGRYMACCIQTTIHVKAFWINASRVLAEDDPEAARAMLAEMRSVGEAEIANAEAAIPFLQVDSRLGWEPSMEYLGSAANVRWKIAHLRLLLDREIPAYEGSLGL